jgi:hypothetical protein
MAEAKSIGVTKNLAVWLVRLITGVGLTLVLASSLGAQTTSACFDSTSKRAQSYKHGYSLMVSRSDTASARQRTNLLLPSLTASQVKLVGDTAVCRLASAAYDSAASVFFPDRPVIVLELGSTRRIVIKDIGFRSAWLNLLFDNTFTSMLSRIGL